MGSEFTPYGYARSRLDPILGERSAHAVAVRLLGPESPIHAFEKAAPYAALFDAYDAERDVVRLEDASLSGSGPFFDLLEELITKQSLVSAITHALLVRSASVKDAVRLSDAPVDVASTAARLERLARIADEAKLVFGTPRADEVRAYAKDLIAAAPALVEIASWYADVVPARGAHDLDVA